MLKVLLILFLSIDFVGQARGADGPFADHAGSPVVTFKFHLNSEIRSLDPAQVSFGYGVGYLFQNIYQGLYIYRDSKLEALGARSCTQKELKITCELNPDFKWSDGKSVEANEYVLAFRHLLGAKSKSSIIAILKNIKNASLVFSDKAKPETLGVKAITPYTLEFSFDKSDPEFLYKLANPLTAPIRNEKFADEKNASEQLVTGPYKIEKWERTKEILLQENLSYIHFLKNKPKVQIFFVDSDQTALNLYDTHKLNFLRMLPTAQIAEYKNHPDYHEIPMTRFDYLGFGSSLQKQPKLREALAKSLDFSELQKMFYSKGLPGCSGLPDEMLNGQVCVKYDLAAAKKAFSQVNQSAREKTYKLAFPNYDGDDVIRAMEWMAEQWKNHLGFKVTIEKMESRVFTASLKDAPPDIFRKSAIVDRPTCLGALESFSNEGSEAFLKIDSEKFEAIIHQMQTAPRKNLCTEGVRKLILDYDLVAMGPMHFTILVSPQFTGWHINELNALDLSRLTYDSSRPE